MGLVQYLQLVFRAKNVDTQEKSINESTLPCISTMVNGRLLYLIMYQLEFWVEVFKQKSAGVQPIQFVSKESTDPEGHTWN